VIVGEELGKELGKELGEELGEELGNELGEELTLGKNLEHVLRFPSGLGIMTLLRT